MFHARSHRSPNSLRAIVVGFVAALVIACGGGGGGSSPSPQPPTPSATLTTVSLTPGSVTLATGATRQFTATGTYSDGTSRDISALVTWTSGTPAIASVSNTGLVAGMTAGSATILAASSGVTGQASVSVTSSSSTLTGLSISPSGPSLASGATRQLTAMGAYSDGTSRDLTASVTWTSSTPAIATVSGIGLVTGLGVGNAFITAASGGISAQTTATVTPATLLSLAITPANASLAVGGTRSFTATGTFSDGSTGSVAVTWSSSTPTVASINSSGVATGLVAGTTTITATSGGITGNATLAVSAATLSSIRVTPASPSVNAGSTTPLVATGTYTDGSTANLSTSVTWTSASQAIALVNAGGLVTGVAAGSTTITATSGAISGSVTLTVIAPATVTLVEVSPISANMTLNATQTFQAIVTWSNGTRLNMSYDVQWTSLNNAVVTIDNLGDATAHAAGSTSIRASYGGVTGQAAVTVTGPTLTSITLTPPTSTLSVGGTVDITAAGNFSNGVSTTPYDNQVNWSSSNASVATVESHGVVTAIGAGTATIRATAGSIVGTATVTVSGPALDPALIGTWQFIDVTGTWGSFYTFYANGTFTYSLNYLNHDVCLNTSKRIAFRSGTASSAPGKIILNITTSYDDVYNCSGAGTRFTFQPSIQVHQASMQSGQLGTWNSNDFWDTGWLWHIKQ
ncbi:MAG: Ig-like domain-containing protein [Holophagaceae bacterium]|uniref:Ig-like domain-containing protein n=1 Tax=Candidatus Geothrix skivensis TaxID=2954439 RepID=A0A9D7SCV0_9BACT|nr:Ig-like domain-containing protein [Candidatus Geothrix skivensis]